MRLRDGNGLDVISAIKKRRPEARALILTGYGNMVFGLVTTPTRSHSRVSGRRTAPLLAV
jgi:hypothetical protein